MRVGEEEDRRRRSAVFCCVTLHFTALHYYAMQCNGCPGCCGVEELCHAQDEVVCVGAVSQSVSQSSQSVKSMKVQSVNGEGT